ncbi:unnamed protein product [Gordionus sp. m RMFG-2023]
MILYNIITFCLLILTAYNYDLDYQTYYNCYYHQNNGTFKYFHVTNCKKNNFLATLNDSQQQPKNTTHLFRKHCTDSYTCTINDTAYKCLTRACYSKNKPRNHRQKILNGSHTVGHHNVSGAGKRIFLVISSWTSIFRGKTHRGKAPVKEAPTRRKSSPNLYNDSEEFDNDKDRLSNPDKPDNHSHATFIDIISSLFNPRPRSPLKSGLILQGHNYSDQLSFKDASVTTKKSRKSYSSFDNYFPVGKLIWLVGLMFPAGIVMIFLVSTCITKKKSSELSVKC